jgi:glycosyltransferase involved in cell wall biosynthesis
MPDRLTVPSVLFTHNVEAEIFGRHAQVAADPLRRLLWRDQYRKMRRFEECCLQRFDRVVAVSERDRAAFAREYGAGHVDVIGTGVDLKYFAFQPAPRHGNVVFTGSMDWMANIDGIEFFMDEVWPLIAAAEPGATMTVVGRDPPEVLRRRAAERRLNWTFTGRVDDVRPYVQRSAAYVIPLRVGGGTRLKVFEAMAMGCPVVSTAIGVEGLPVEHGRHYLRADTAAAMAQSVIELLRSPDAGRGLAIAGRELVEQRCSFESVARDFERICIDTLTAGQPAAGEAACATSS